MGRYYDADDKAVKLLTEIVDKGFPELRPIRIKLIIDSKLKIDKLRDAPTFAYIKAANDVERFLTKSGMDLNGVDYFVFVNELVWDLASEINKKRIISHELRHAYVDPESGACKLVKHDIEDFFAEIELNKDDPKWAAALGAVVIAKYEQMKEEAKEQK
jgi:hypothetical protein